MIPDRRQHQRDVRRFLENCFSIKDWKFSLPHGWGHESYFAKGGKRTYFIKLGARTANYTVMADLDLTPPVIASGVLEDGTPVMVQPYIEGKVPGWVDFKRYLHPIAEIVGKMHHSTSVHHALPNAPCEDYRGLARIAHQRLLQKWQIYKGSVPEVVAWVDKCLDTLGKQSDTLDGSGAMAVHNDICNANWLITPDERIYLIDLDSMTLDDPACDLGAILWWYYPPDLRGQFLEIAGYKNDTQLQKRMRTRMALHCLDILLPREHSFDHFDAHNFAASLEDFKAIIAGEENPRGYED